MKSSRFYAYFVESPRTLQDLMRPHLPEQEQLCEAVKDVTLSLTDYENFITDLTVDRAFLEGVPATDENSGPWKCAFVHAKGSTDGILAVPKEGRFVRCAAFGVGVKTRKPSLP